MNHSCLAHRLILFAALSCCVSGCIETDPPAPNNTAMPDASTMETPDMPMTGGPNTAPVAAPGADQMIRLGERVVLDGSGSFDAEDDPLTYSWSMIRPQSSDAMLEDETMAVAGFLPDVPGDYTATLVVNDGKVDSVPATISITVMGEDITNLPPVADAGVNRAIELGQPAMLDGSASSDPEGQPLTFAWSLVSAPQGSSAEIMDVESAMATLTPDVEGMYQIRLIVSDGLLGSNPALLTLTAVPDKPENQAPVARQAANQNVEVGDMVTLDGTSSQDPDGDTLLYQWSLDVPA